MLKLNEQFMLLYATTRQHPQPLFARHSLFRFSNSSIGLLPFSPFLRFLKELLLLHLEGCWRTVWCGTSARAHGVSEGDDAALIAFGGGMGGVLCTRVACCQGADPSFFLSSSRMLMLPCSFCNFEAWRRLMDSAPSHQLG